MPDVVAKRIIEDVIAPHFRAGDMGAGISAGVDAMMAAAKGEFVPPERRPGARGEGSGGPGGFLAALFFGSVWAGVLGGLRRPLGALLGGGIGGGLAWLFTGSLVFALGAAFLCVLFGLMIGGAQVAHLNRVGRGRGTWTGSGGFGGGGFGGGFGGGGFGGGGGGFGGGGASGGW